MIFRLNILIYYLFVINFVNAPNAEAMNITATELPADVNEFERANLSPLASKIISVPRVAQSSIHFECKLHEIVAAGDGNIIIGEVVYMHFQEGVYQAGNYINIEAYQPIARLAGKDYAHITDIFQLERPPSEIKT